MIAARLGDGGRLPGLRVGLDVGGTKIHAVALGRGNEVVAELVRPTGHGESAVAANVLATITELGARSGGEAQTVGSIGVGIPGVVDTETGRVARAVNLGVDVLDLGELIAQATGALTVVENDVNVGAVGAAHFMDRDEGSVAYLNLGTGLAAGLAVDGRVWRGAHGVAGEIGHHPIADNDLLCLCGQVGCLETITSGVGLARAWPTVAGRPSTDLLQHVGAGHPGALRVWQRFVEGVTIAVQLIAVTWDPHIIAIGGGLVAIGHPLRDAVVRELRARDSRSAFVASLLLSERVRFLSAEDPIAPVGAALLGARGIAIR